MRSNGNTEVTSLRLHTDREGLGMILGPLELAIMRALWEEGGRACTNKRVHLALTRSGLRLALPTVATTMHRLTTKGLVLEHQQGKKVYTYKPAFTEEELETFVVEHVLYRLRANWPAIMHSYDVGEMVQ